MNNLISRDQQLNILKKGEIFVSVDSPATVKNGIIKLSKTELQEYINFFTHYAKNVSQESFIPASGAASRMFKDLLDLENNNTLGLLKNIAQYPFYNKLKKSFIEEGKSIEKATHEEILTQILSSEGLNFSKLPKGMIPFKIIDNNEVTPFEQHIHENILFQSHHNTIKLHFTVSDNFKKQIEELINNLNSKNNLSKKVEITYSAQNKKTNTICIDENDEVVVDEKTSEELTRPAGHGTLLENLNRLNSEIIFINNIDNINLNPLNSEPQKYKQALGGLLLKLVEQRNLILKELSTGRNVKEILEQNADFFQKTGVEFSLNNPTTNEIIDLINRPIRVCGMVKNEGQPGGGPFWVKSGKNTISKQIVESVHININKQNQKEALKKATHFNPVNIVCNIFDDKGNKFDLQKFIDPDAFLVSWKTLGDKKIKILEYPGLWNGSMTNWLTVFVDTPSETFNPVKTVFDLVK